MTTRTSWDTACHLGAFRDFQTPNPAGVSKCRGTCTESTQICQRPMKHYGAFRESQPQTGGVPPNLSLKISNRILHDLAFWLICFSLPSQFLIQCNELDAACSITVFLLPVFLWSPDAGLLGWSLSGARASRLKPFMQSYKVGSPWSFGSPSGWSEVTRDV